MDQDETFMKTTLLLKLNVMLTQTRMNDFVLEFIWRHVNYHLQICLS